MNVYEFARECEKAAEKTYLNLAVKAGNKGMKAIFTMLAEMGKKTFRCTSPVGKIAGHQTA